jgi:hypothetical protein
MKKSQRWKFKQTLKICEITCLNKKKLKKIKRGDSGSKLILNHPYLIDKQEKRSKKI